jgi:hypothetical protein
MLRIKLPVALAAAGIAGLLAVSPANANVVTASSGAFTITDRNDGKLTAVGFNINPNATTATDNSAIFDSFLNQNFPSFQTVVYALPAGRTAPVVVVIWLQACRIHLPRH